MPPVQSLTVRGVRLCVQAFGTPLSADDPAVLLVPGGASSMDWWDPAFCERLAAPGRRVVRYDPRDTGGSHTDPAGAPTYGFDDWVADAFGVLDALGVGRADVVGMSIGGTVGLEMALVRPDRVASLALISSSPGDAAGRPALPPMSPALAAYFASTSDETDWADRDVAIDEILASLDAFAGRIPVDPVAMRARVAQGVDRSADLAASHTNHWLVGRTARPLRDRLGEVAVPTAVLHGTDDPLYPLPHGEALAREIPAATWWPLDGMGHEMPPPVLWDRVVEALETLWATRR